MPHLLRTDAEEPAVGVVDEGQGTILVVDPDQHRQVVGHEPEARLAVLQGDLEELAIGDVDDGSDEAEEVAVGVQARCSGVQRPAVLAVGSTQPVVQPERTSLRRGGGELRCRPVAVVGVHRVEPQRPQAARQGLSGEVAPAPAQVAAAAVRLGDPHHDRSVVSHVAEAALALVQRLERDALLGDVAEQQGEPAPGVQGRDEHVEPAAHDLGPSLDPGHLTAQRRLGVDLQPLGLQPWDQVVGAPTDCVLETGVLLEELVGLDEQVVDGLTVGPEHELADTERLVQCREDGADPRLVLRQCSIRRQLVPEVGDEFESALRRRRNPV